MSEKLPRPRVHDHASLIASTSSVITREEAAAVFGVDPRTITAAINRGELPTIKIGKRTFIKRVPLVRALEEDAA